MDKNNKDTKMEDTTIIENKNDMPIAKSDEMVIDLSLFLTPAVVFVSALVIAGAIIFSSTLTNNSNDTLVGKLTSAMGNIKVSGGTAAATTQEAAPAVTVTEEQVKSLITDKSLTFGDKNAKLKFVEFTDPSCPYCHIAVGLNSQFNTSSFQSGRFATAANGGTYVPPVAEMEKLAKEGKASLTLVYTLGHSNGELTAQAWYCAKEKGDDTFWAFHDLMMSSAGYDLINNVVLNDVGKADTLAEFSKSVIDKDFLVSCLKSTKYKNQVAADNALGSAFGVQGTPGFFVGTTAFNGAYSWTDMAAAVAANQ